MRERPKEWGRENGEAEDNLNRGGKGRWVQEKANEIKYELQRERKGVR